ncbi:MAG: hypothetical protein M5U15_13715 [Kiritimatiellae bacterium]|nr:hypothetical protein [Kiritimatiellia bacterium]
MISVNITDTLTPHHRRVMSTLSSTRPLMARLGKTAEVIIKNRFEDQNRRPNKRGWPKKNFWTQVKRSTALNSVSEREATVAISDPRFALQYHGGTVSAKRSRFLAVPLTAAAYAAGSPREGNTPNLFVLKSRSGRGAYLAEAEPFAWRGTVRLWYALKRAVNVPRNPDALPPEGDIAAALDREARAYLDAVLQKGTA